MNDNNHIGLLGLGNRSTLFYLDQINQIYQLKHGGFSTCPLTLINTNFDRINPFLPDQFDEIINNLLPYLKKFEEVAIGKLIIPNITLHETMELINGLKIDFVHPVKSTLETLKRDKCHKIMLFASMHSMRSDYISSLMLKKSVEMSVPLSKDMEIIDKFRQKIYWNKETKDELEVFINLLKKYAQDHTIVIACTELSLVLPEGYDNIYDMAQIQIKTLMK